MFVKELESEAQYFLIEDEDTFVSVAYDGEVLTYSFVVYGRMLQALVDGYDEVQVQIAEKMAFKYKYFKGPTPDDVENATVGFVQNVSKALAKLEKKETIVEDIFPINRFVSDEHISKVGSGFITSKNYPDYLNVMDVLVASTAKSDEQIVLSGSGLEALASPVENKSPTELCGDLFENFGIFPGLISHVTFPRQCEMDRDSGKSRSLGCPIDELLEINGSFRDLYSHFFSITPNLEMVTSLTKGKPEFQKMIFSISLPADDDALSELIGKRNLLLRISLLKSGIEVVQQNFRFNNYELFVRLSAHLKDVSVELLVHDPITVLPDTAIIKNPNNFPVDVTLFKFIPSDSGILDREKVAEGTIAPGSTEHIESDTIFFDASETRAYAITANRALGGLPGVGNVRSLKAPPSIQKPAIETVIPLLTVRDGGDGVTITLSGLPEVGYTAILYKTELGYLDDIVMGKVTGNSSWVDDDVYDGSIFVYTARIFMNDAAGRLVAETPSVWYAPRETALRLGFSIAGQKSIVRGSRVNHVFTIKQSVSTTPASQMLETVQESGEAAEYSAELTAEKTDTSIIADYMVYQYNRKRGRMRYMGVYQADKQLNFSMTAKRARRIIYYVVPRVTAAAALSYLTTTDETDEASGQSYSISYKKWRDPMANRQEILPSYGEVVRNDLAQSLLNAPSGLVKSVDMATSGKIGIVRNLDADYDSKTGSNFITWEFSGDLSNIAYFVVMASYNGIKAPVGLAIPDGRTSRELISYADTVLGGALGMISYSVVPITVAGILASESRSKAVANLSTYPTAALLRT